jgi:hypothetical protein
VESESRRAMNGQWQPKQIVYFFLIIKAIPDNIGNDWITEVW